MMSTSERDQTLTPEQQEKFLVTGQLFHALAADPKYRRKVLGLIKEAAPETPIPELDLEGNLLKSVEEKLKPAQDLFKTVTDRLDSIDRTLLRKDWATQHNLGEAELVEIEELAKKEQIGSAGAALELWRSRQMLGTPRGTRKSPPGAEEYLKKVQSVSPRDAKKLKALATEEATRILTAERRG